MNNGLLEYVSVPESPSLSQQAANRQFLREGLHDPAPIASGSLDECEKHFNDIEISALRSIQRDLRGEQIIGTVEVYKEGFNMFIRGEVPVRVVGIYRFRGRE